MNSINDGEYPHASGRAGPCFRVAVDPCSNWSCSEFRRPYGDGSRPGCFEPRAGVFRVSIKSLLQVSGRITSGQFPPKSSRALYNLRQNDELAVRTCAVKKTQLDALTTGSFRAAIVPEGQLRASVLTAVPDLLRELGHDPDQLLREGGVDAMLLSDPENLLPFQSVGALLEHCVARTGCRHFGLLIGQRSRIGMLGVLGLLVENSPDVGTALRNLVQHLHLHDRGAVPTLGTAGRAVMMGYVIYQREVPATEQIYAAAMGVACNIMRVLCGPDWHPDEVRFPFRKPRETGPFRRFFRASLRFDAEHAALVFPSTWLQRPVSAFDPRVRGAAEKLAAVLQGKQRDSIVARARRALCVMLVSGNASEGELALALAVHRRTLNRRLRSEGTTFREVLDDVRFDIACQMLRSNEAPVAQIASSLAYGSASAFSRAFRRRCGINPSQWRDGDFTRLASR